MSLADYVVTEAGFAADLGAEKFFNIKCVAGGLKPEAVVLVATVRALRHHGGCKKEEQKFPSAAAVEKGLANLDKHVENIRKFNLEPLVLINFFPGDTTGEITLIKEHCAGMGIKAKQVLRQIRDLGFDHMPVCMAKTPKSLSDDEKQIGRPIDCIVIVREFEIASGAGFVIPILGDILRMPGLPLYPAAEKMDIDDQGKIVGLF